MRSRSIASNLLLGGIICALVFVGLGLMVGLGWSADKNETGLLIALNWSLMPIWWAIATRLARFTWDGFADVWFQMWQGGLLYNPASRHTASKAQLEKLTVFLEALRMRAVWIAVVLAFVLTWLDVSCVVLVYSPKLGAVDVQDSQIT